LKGEWVSGEGGDVVLRKKNNTEERPKGSPPTPEKGSLHQGEKSYRVKHNDFIERGQPFWKKGFMLGGEKA